MQGVPHLVAQLARAGMNDIMAVPVSSPEAVLRGYFYAKDENRPFLLAGVFAPDVELQVVNRASSIEFPALTTGRDALADVLVRRFNQTYENIYSFYMARPPDDARAFLCDWLVFMTEKDSRNVRVGCGRYDWTLQPALPCLASRLCITVQAMLVLSPTEFDAIYRWLGRLDYPWSSAIEAAKHAPSVESLAPVLQYLGRNAGGA
jgi:hypothetical protein